MECVACMKLHHTIHKHPLLRKISHKVFYKEYDLDELLYIEKNNLIHLLYGSKKEGNGDSNADTGFIIGTRGVSNNYQQQGESL